MSLTDDLKRLSELKLQAARIDKERKELEAEVVKAMALSGQRKVSWPAPLGTSASDRAWKVATLVEPTTVKFDEESLQRALTDEQWQAITKTTLDPKALEHEVASGNISFELVAEHSEEQKIRSYIRFGNTAEPALDQGVR